MRCEKNSLSVYTASSFAAVSAGAYRQSLFWEHGRPLSNQQFAPIIVLLCYIASIHCCKLRFWKDHQDLLFPPAVQNIRHLSLGKANTYSWIPDRATHFFEIPLECCLQLAPEKNDIIHKTAIAFKVMNYLTINK